MSYGEEGEANAGKDNIIQAIGGEAQNNNSENKLDNTEDNEVFRTGEDMRWHGFCSSWGRHC